MGGVFCYYAIQAYDGRGGKMKRIGVVGIVVTGGKDAVLEMQSVLSPSRSSSKARPKGCPR